ncbi:hypothetical protein, partial [Frankia sp. AgW1.1]
TPYIRQRIETDVRALIHACDPTPAGLARVAKTLLALMTGRHDRAAAPTAWTKVTEALGTLPTVHADAMRALLGIGLPPRTTMLERRIRAAAGYDLSAGHYAKTWEPQGIDMLVDALAERADPAATLPTPPKWRIALLRTPPPLISVVRATRTTRTTRTGRSRRGSQPR